MVLIFDNRSNHKFRKLPGNSYQGNSPNYNFFTRPLATFPQFTINLPQTCYTASKVDAPGNRRQRFQLSALNY